MCSHQHWLHLVDFHLLLHLASLREYVVIHFCSWSLNHMCSPYQIVCIISQSLLFVLIFVLHHFLGCMYQTASEVQFCTQVTITFSCEQEVCNVHFISPVCLISAFTFHSGYVPQTIQFYILTEHLFHHTLFMDSGYVLISHSRAVLTLAVLISNHSMKN